MQQFVATALAPPRRDAEPAAQTLAPKRKRMRRKGTPAPAEEDREDGGKAGANIGWQVTGCDAAGGIQLEIIPAYDAKSMHTCALKNVCPGVDVYDVLETPAEEGLQAGDVMHVKDLTTRRAPRAKVVADLARELPLPLPAVGAVELEVYRWNADEISFDLFLAGQSKP